jgi:tetratricopeptide (TPR) repeat protein
LPAGVAVELLEMSDKIAAQPKRPARLAKFDAHFQHSVAILEAGQHENPLVSFHRVLELAPNLSDAHVNADYALLGMQRHLDAHDYFLSAIELKPNQVNTYYGLALALAGW